MQRWEHKIFSNDDPASFDELEALGDEGWELVGFSERDWSQENQRKGYMEHGTIYSYAFKRPKQSTGSAPTLGGENASK